MRALLLDLPPPVIRPIDQPGERFERHLIGLSQHTIEWCLGFPPNIDEGNTLPSWGFSVDGVVCGVWASKRVSLTWSACGPLGALISVFGEDHVSV